MADDLTLEELASYLHLTPMQVMKLASRNKIPGRKVGGEWRFSEVEIHHWLEDQIGVSDEATLGRVEEVLKTQEKRETGQTETVRLSDLITPELIKLPLNSRSKRAVIKEICEHCVASGLLWDPGAMAEAIMAREELHPTALDNGVALLHPRRPMANILGDRFLALGVSTQGIPFGGPQGGLTDVFFLLASTDDGIHLRTLARLSRLLALPDFLSRLRDCESEVEAYQLIESCDEEIPD